MRLVAAAALAAGALLAAPMPGAADGRGEYLAAVQRARALITSAQSADARTAAQKASQAATALRTGTGTSQAEILLDLDANPPQLNDAAARLDALQQSLGQPVATGDAGRADREVKSILAEPRYQPSGPNLLQLIEDWLLRQLAHIFGGAAGSGDVVTLVELAFAATVGTVLLVVLLRAFWSRRGGAPARLRQQDAAARAAHSFAEADRLAAEGDFLRALKALTSAVATSIGGIGTWEASPFTVRELFVEKGVIDELEPLVTPFEAAVYGRRVPDEATYRRAAEAVAAFRAAAAAARGQAA
ncbi:MAG TPA: hypothetical protein VG329_06070 [Candidatus Dormibacteraeota bacterium]|nr:hypothetical protein [Candidatus Dormibacteraeota bacterium]